MRHTTGSDALFLPVWIAAAFGTIGTPDLATAESAEGTVVEVARGAPLPMRPARYTNGWSVDAVYPASWR
jgi:hypothetical protein